MSIQQKESFVKPKGNKFRFIVLFREGKYLSFFSDKRKAAEKKIFFYLAKH